VLPLRSPKIADLGTAIRDRVISLYDGRLIDKWTVACRIFVTVGDDSSLDPTVRKGRRLVTLQTSLGGKRVHAIIDGTKIVETEVGFEHIILRAKGLWTPRVNGVIQVGFFGRFGKCS
jgi:hypothetical protein